MNIYIYIYTTPTTTTTTTTNNNNNNYMGRSALAGAGGHVQANLAARRNDCGFLLFLLVLLLKSLNCSIA